MFDASLTWVELWDLGLIVAPHADHTVCSGREITRHRSERERERERVRIKTDGKQVTVREVGQGMTQIKKSLNNSTLLLLVFEAHQRGMMKGGILSHFRSDVT